MPFIESPSRQYDYVVVGAGSAGCYIARRLAQAGVGTILLVEAGGPYATPHSAVPVYYPRLFGGSNDWGYQTTAQKNLAGRRIAFPRGKGLGGCGGMNALIYLRGASADYRRWGWPGPPGPAGVDDNTRRSLRCGITDLPIAPVSQPHPWTKEFLTAAEAVGFDLQDPLQQSVAGAAGCFALTQAVGRRQHTGLQLAGQLDSLSSIDVLTNWQVAQVRLDGRPEVLVKHASQAEACLSVRATKQLVLSAGAIGSPALLLRSGIGAREEIPSAESAVIDLPAVGQNLQDHLVYPLVFSTKGNAGLPLRFSRQDRDAFRRQGTGPMASNIAEAGAFFSLDDDVDSPQFQLHFTPTHYLKYPMDGKPNCLSIAVTHLRPRSTGRVSLDGSECAIDPAYLSDQNDAANLNHAIEYVRERFTRHLGHLVSKELLPGRRADKPGGLSRSVAAFSQSIYHPTSTCRMGASSVDSVVNEKFELHGCPALMIADASVLPDIPSGNTQVPTFWAAERCVRELLSRG